MNKEETKNFYVFLINAVHWSHVDIVVKEMVKTLGKFHKS